MAEIGPTTTLHVSNLPFGTAPEVLKQVFGTAVVECSVLPPDSSGNMVAMVLFQSVEDATAAKERLDGHVPEELAEGMQIALSIRFSPPLVVPNQAYGAAGAAPPARPSPYGLPPTSEARTSSDNLYVKGLPQATDYESLMEMFSKYGQVTRCKVIDAKTPFQSAHALVQYATPEEAAAVKDTLDGVTLPDAIEPLSLGFVVSKGKGGPYKGAPPPWEAAAHGGWGWDGGKGWGKPAGKGMLEMRGVVKQFHALGVLPGPETMPAEGAEIYVSGLPYDCCDVDMYRMFSPFGAIAPYGVALLKHPDGSSRGFAFITYLDPMAATAAVSALNGAKIPQGAHLKVVHKIANYRATKGIGKDGSTNGAAVHPILADGYGEEAAMDGNENAGFI
mmetsp:Transcript_21304/g.38934  ORF Transcript_21304/g.38934 Transcript_21304/m.38934 type:complete len:390 (+) Transcript_21304:76-1245(+)